MKKISKTEIDIVSAGAADCYCYTPGLAPSFHPTLADLLPGGEIIAIVDCKKFCCGNYPSLGQGFKYDGKYYDCNRASNIGCTIL